MKILITGGTGFVGRHLAQALSLDIKNEIHTLSRSPRSQLIGTHHAVDLADRDVVMDIVTSLRPEWIFHLAGDIRRENRPELYKELYATNVVGTQNLLEAASLISPLAFIAVGSFEEYGNVQTPFREDGEMSPSSTYGLTKADASRRVVAFGKQILNAAVLRFSLLYGSGAPETTFLGRLARLVLQGGSIKMASGIQKRDFLYIDDAVRALVMAAQNIERCRGEVINICSGEEVSLLEVIALVEELTHRYGLAEINAVPHRSNEQFSYVGSNEKAKKLLGWVPRTSLRDGLGTLFSSNQYTI